MALNETILGEQLYSAIKAKNPSKTLEVWTEIAKVILDHIKQNGDVTVTVQTTTGSGTGTGKMT